MRKIVYAASPRSPGRKREGANAEATLRPPAEIELKVTARENSSTLQPTDELSVLVEEESFGDYIESSQLPPYMSNSTKIKLVDYSSACSNNKK